MRNEGRHCWKEGASQQAPKELPTDKNPQEYSLLTLDRKLKLMADKMLD